MKTTSIDELREKLCNFRESLSQMDKAIVEITKLLEDTEIGDSQKGVFKGENGKIRPDLDNLNEKTKDFIKKYLKVGADFQFQDARENRKEIQNDIRHCNRKTIQHEIRKLPYKDFLNTPYWKALARYVKYRYHNRCQICGSSKDLAVHHNTYIHHGNEFSKWKTDLLCICSDCHQKHHKK